MSPHKQMTINCIMLAPAGQHYFLGTSNATSDCNDLQGVFLLYDSEELIGMGLIPFGSFTSDERTWFEDPPVLAVKVCDLRLNSRRSIKWDK